MRSALRPVNFSQRCTMTSQYSGSSSIRNARRPVISALILMGNVLTTFGSNMYLIREIAAKGTAARFKKHERGVFVAPPRGKGV